MEMVKLSYISTVKILTPNTSISASNEDNIIDDSAKYYVMQSLTNQEWTFSNQSSAKFIPVLTKTRKFHMIFYAGWIKQQETTIAGSTKNMITLSSSRVFDIKTSKGIIFRISNGRNFWSKKTKDWH